MHYKPTDSHSYLQHSSSHPAHVKNFIPYSQFLRLRRLCSDDTDFSEIAEEMCQFFKTSGYPDYVFHNSKLTTAAQSVNPQSTPPSSHNKEKERMPLPIISHPHNISVKNNSYFNTIPPLLSNNESRKNMKQKFIFQTGTLSHSGINERISFL